MSNSLGNIFRITCFGESHGSGIGVVIDGCPAGLCLSEADIQPDVDRRRPGATAGSTSRHEKDSVEILSGICEGHTTGAPVCLMVRNEDTNSSDYLKNRALPRPGHADYTAFVKYGGFNDIRGGGQFSGRITLAYVMAGAVARKLLAGKGIEIMAHTISLGGIDAAPQSHDRIRAATGNPLRCADAEAAVKMSARITEAQKAGDSLGGIIEGLALNVPAGLGEPVFATLEGEIARAMFAIPAVKGVEFGAGFAAARSTGAENNDPFVIEDGKIVTVTNHAGGILGGISNGMPLVVRVAVKPTPSIAKTQPTVDMKKMTPAEITVQGRHDVTIVPRAVPVVEAMLALTLCDFARTSGMITGVLA